LAILQQFFSYFWIINHATMKKLYTLIVALFIIGNTVNAQTSLNLSWLTGFGNTLNDNIIASAIDNQGNVYITGYFNGVIDFDFGPGTATLNANTSQGFIAKYTSNGSYLWAVAFNGTGNSSGTAIDIDNANNLILLAGKYAGPLIDLNPSSPGTYTLNGSTINEGLYMSTFNLNTGACTFAQSLGSATSNFEVNAIRACNTGFVIGGAVSSETSSPVDFNPQGPSIIPTSYGNPMEAFVASYSLTGQAQWAFLIGSYLSDYVDDLQVDASNDVYISGSFQDPGFTVGFDPLGTSNATLTTAGNQDMFIAKYDGSNGHMIWAKSIGGAMEDVANKIKLDNAGNILVAGYFDSPSIDADPSPSNTLTLNKQGSGTTDLFLGKYNASNGNLIWAKNAGGSGQAINSGLTIDAQQNIYTTGYFTNDLNFDYLTAAPSVSTIASPGVLEHFIAKYKSDATLDTYEHFGGASSMGSKSTGLLLNSNNDIILTGFYMGTVNVDPVSTNNLPVFGGADMFMVKYTQCVMANTPTLVTTTTSMCANSQVTLSISAGNLNSATNWVWANSVCGASSIGTGTSIVISPAVSTSYFVRGEGGCTSPGACASATVTVVNSKDISGQATSTANPVSGGNVVLYRYESILTKWDSVTYQNISVNGDYTFTAVHSGSYILLVNPNDNTLQSTYAPGVSGWKNAQIIPHGCLNTTSINVNVLPLLNLGGPGILTGKVIEGVGYGQKSANPMAPGNPIKGLTIKGGRNPGGDVSAEARTNALGEYTLTGFPADVIGETYFVFVDVPGLDTLGTHHRAIVTGSLVHTHLNFVIDSMYIKPYTDVSVQEFDLNDTQWMVYPNPAQSKLYIQLQDTKAGEYKSVGITLLDIIGKETGVNQTFEFSSVNNRFELDLKDINSGIYLLRIESKNTQKIIKIIKTD